jgi:hypothetical protein
MNQLYSGKSQYSKDVGKTATQNQTYIPEVV